MPAVLLLKGRKALGCQPVEHRLQPVHYASQQLLSANRDDAALQRCRLPLLPLAATFCCFCCRRCCCLLYKRIYAGGWFAVGQVQAHLCREGGMENLKLQPPLAAASRALYACWHADMAAAEYGKRNLAAEGCAKQCGVSTAVP